MKKLLFTMLISGFLVACNNDPTQPTATVENPAANLDPNATPVESLRSVALEESDILGRLRQSFVPLQEEFNNSKGVVPEIGEMKVSVDEQYNLLIENKLAGHAYLTKVKISNLKSKDGGMQLLPDSESRKFPGLRINIDDSQQKVQYFKDGKLEKEEEFIEFSLKDRPAMEKVVPAIVQAINIASGTTPK